MCTGTVLYFNNKNTKTGWIYVAVFIKWPFRNTPPPIIFFYNYIFVFIYFLPPQHFYSKDQQKLMLQIFRAKQTLYY